MSWSAEGKGAGKFAKLGLLLAVAVILGYVEALIPFNIGLPGMKLGLCNCALLFVLYAFGPVEAAVVSVLRTLIIALLFTNLPMLCYSLSGALVSILLMSILRRGVFSVYGVSMAGGAAHSLTQLSVALLIAGLSQSGSSFLLSYAALLTVCGAAAGAVNAFLVSLIFPRVHGTTGEAS